MPLVSTTGQMLPKGLAPYDQFSTIPGMNDPKELLFRYQLKLIESMKVYLKKIGESFQISLNSLLELLENLDPNVRFSPEIFSIYVRLRDAYPKKDLHGIFDALQSIRNLTQDSYYCVTRSFSSILTESWETPFIAELRGGAPVDEHGAPLTKQVRMLPLVHWEPNHFPPQPLHEAEELISQLDNGLWEEYQTYVSKIKLFSGRVMEGITSARFFGNIYLRLPHPEEDPLLFYFEHVIHEASHLHLYAMMGEDPIILNDEHETFSSPLRVDKRPMSGIFHAAFVISRIIRSLKRLCLKFPENTKAKTISKNCERLLLEALETIDKFAKLTTPGKALFLTMEPCAFE